MNTWLAAALLVAAIIALIVFIGRTTKDGVLLVFTQAAAGPAVLAFVVAAVVTGLSHIYDYDVGWSVVAGVLTFLPALFFIRWLLGK